MACIKYKATYSSTAKQSSVSIAFDDCDGIRRSITVAKGETVEFCATAFKTDLGLIQGLTVTGSEFCGESSGGVVGDGKVNTVSANKYYQLRPCNGQSVVMYTMRTPTVSAERVGVSNSTTVGVPSDISWVYNGKSVEAQSSPGTLAIGVTGTGFSGCPIIQVEDSDVIDTVGSTSLCARFKVTYTGTPDVIVVWRRCSDGFSAKRTLKKGCTAYFSARGIETIQVVSNLNEVGGSSSVPSSSYSIVEEGKYPSPDDFVQVDCPVVPEKKPEDGINPEFPGTPPCYRVRLENPSESTYTISYLDCSGITVTKIINAFRYYEYCSLSKTPTIVSSTGQGNLVITDLGTCASSTIDEGDLNKPTVLQGCQTYKILNDTNNYLTFGYNVCPGTNRTAIITVRPKSQEIICVDLDRGHLQLPQGLTKEHLGNCSPSNLCRGYVIQNISQTSVVVAIPKCYDTDICYDNKVIGPGESWNVCLSAKGNDFYIELLQGSISQIRVLNEGQCDEPTCSDPEVEGDVYVDITFREIITPSLPKDVQLNQGAIKLDGKIIGYGSVTKTLVVGRNYNVTFEQPSAKNYTFSNGAPPSIDFTATLPVTLYESYFEASYAPTKGKISVFTSYDPNIKGSVPKGDIFINGGQSIGKGSASVELPAGEYVISFGDIKVTGMSYTTPSPIKVVLNVGDTRTVTGNYVGKFLPKGYWLKPIDAIDKFQYNSLITKSLFSDNIGNLVDFYVSSSVTPVGSYYAHVYHKPITHATSSIQFSLAYGHLEGSGSNDQGGQYNDTVSRAIYGQYKSIILGRNAEKFNLAGEPTKHFYALSFQKDRRDTRADYKAFEINLAHLSGSEFIAGAGTMTTHTGSNVTLSGTGEVLRLVSDYAINTYGDREYPDSPIGFNIVSGSIEDGIYNSESPHYYGKLYPSLGLVLLDANKLDVSASFGTVTSREVDGNNELKIFTAISGAAQYQDASGDYLGMKARAVKEELVYHYFVHVKNNELNFSNNPTFIVPGEDGEIISDFKNNPKTYITSIGLYDQNRNLIAVGKLSQAEANSFTDEVLFNVKLKF